MSSQGGESGAADACLYNSSAEEQHSSDIQILIEKEQRELHRCYVSLLLTVVEDIPLMALNAVMMAHLRDAPPTMIISMLLGED